MALSLWGQGVNQARHGDAMQDHNAAPLNPLPMVIWALALPMIALEVVVQAGAAGMGGPMGGDWRFQAISLGAVVPDLFREMASLGSFPPEHLLRLVVYPFIHGNLTHALFAIVILLALGKFVGEVLRGWQVLAVFFASAIAGALVYCALPMIKAPLFGAYPAVYGLIGAFTLILYLRLQGSGVQYRAFQLIGMLMAVQLLFGLIFGTSWEWVADLSGFAAGFGLTLALMPGAIARLRNRLRGR